MTRTAVLHIDLAATRSPLRDSQSRLQEAIGLVNALDVDLRYSGIASIEDPHPGSLLGSGKIDDLAGIFQQNDIELVIIDGQLSPVQQRNLEKIWHVKILDRTGLILEIFGDRARTREGVLQVELAHLTYQRSRLVRSWTHLERQRGGLGFIGGPGESQIEADRRMIDDRIIKLRRQLDRAVKTRTLQRAARKRAPYPVVALVGYTNAGKSTLFNRLTQASVLSKDMMFATLDPTMRALQIHNQMIILSDTVGFISDLPTQLVAAFRATLEEVLEADLIVHVRDVSSPENEAQKQDVITVLQELGVTQAKQDGMIEAFNKIDLLPLEDTQQWYNLANRQERTVCISAISGEGLPALEDLIREELEADYIQRSLKLPPEAGEALAWLYRHATILSREDGEDGIDLILSIAPMRWAKFLKVFDLNPQHDLASPPLDKGQPPADF